MASYVGKIKDTNGVTAPIGSTLYGTCDTAAGTAAKVVTLANFDELLTGVTIHVKFTNSNTATNPTLNVNSTGAKSIYRYGTTVPSTSASWSWYAGSVVSFTYDGSAWIMNDMIGNDNTYDRTYIQTRIYAGTNGVFPYCICAIDNNQRMQAMTTTGGTGTSKAFNSSQKFLYPPVVMYHSANSTITNGNVIANAALYEQFPSADLRYSCNITTSAGFTQYKPVYIECSFDTDGYWSPSGITQTFVAGKFYILLGCMYSTSIYQLALFAEHPVYYCETAGTIKKWELLGSKYKNGYWGITSPYGADNNWTRTTREGLIPYAANRDSTDGNVSKLGTSTWSFVDGYINNLYYKDLKPITVVAGGTADNGIDKMAGSYFFSGNSLIGGINDWIGLQAGYSGDKFQLMSRGGTASMSGQPLYRGNDSGGTNTDNWSSWNGLLIPSSVTADTGLSASIVNLTFGSGATAEDVPIGVKISHTNSVTAQTDFNKPYVQYNAQGHITKSSYFVHTASGTGGEAGWVKIATLKHTKTYDNTPIMLTISQRGNTINFRLHIVFQNVNSTDPPLSQFLLVSDHAWESINARAYIIKSATSTWDLYILKLDNYESIAVSSFDAGGYFQLNNTWTWKNEQTAASAITGGTEATKKVYSTTGHTHNYAGSSSAGGAATSANKLNTNAGSEVQPVYFSDGIPVVTHLPDSGEYYGVPQIRQADGLMEVGKYIDFHSAVTSANDYDVRLQCDDTNVLTLASKGGTATLKISGTLPRLRFSQTTSGKAYNDEKCGITAHPASTSGVNLVMAGGGNTFVGGGESPHNLHACVVTTDTNPYGTSSFIGNEKMFLTSDDEIYFVSGANGLTTTAHTDWTNLKTALFDSAGNFRPSINDKGSIGTSSYRWRNVYARSLDGNLRCALVYDNASNFASYPWHKFAEMTITDANFDSIITFLVSRTMNDGDKIGILTVRVRTERTKIFSSGYIHFNYHDSDLNPDHFVAVYTNTANTSCKIELYCKITERYGGVIATVLKEHNRVDTIDSWTLTQYSASANGVASVPAGTGHLTMLSGKQEVLYEKTGFTRTSWNTVTFSKNVFGVYKLALLIIDQCQIETSSYENAATYILPLDYIKSLGVDAYPPYLTGTGWSTKNNTNVNYVGPEGDPWDVAVTYVSNTSLQFSRSGNANMATNNANVKIIGIM